MTRAILLVVPVAFAILASAGCDDPFIDPFVEGRHFTVYGYLHEFDDEHFVRVVAVRRFPEDIPTPRSPHAELDAVVTSTDLSTGRETRWLHTLERLDDGSYGHVFRAAFVVHRGREYRLTVTRSDGAQSIATTKIPNFRNWTVEPAEVDGAEITQQIFWPGLATPESIEISYCAKPVGAFLCNSVIVPYGRKGERTEEGWVVVVDLGRDLLFVRQQLGVANDQILELSSLDMLMTGLDEQWTVPPEPIDVNEFGQPDALNNVESGFGFWGSIGRSTASWMPRADALAPVGFVPP